MSKYKEINLEEGIPTVDEAMSYLKMSIALCKQKINKSGCQRQPLFVVLQVCTWFDKSP